LTILQLEIDTDKFHQNKFYTFLEKNT